MPADRAAGLLCLFLVSLVPVSGCGESRSGSTRPNVLLLVMDTTRGDRVSFNGAERTTTPRLDAFAASSVVFQDAWVPAGWTGPAHATLLTGLRPQNHGYYRGNREYLAGEIETLTHLFLGAGYETGCLSNNGAVSPESGLLSGFTRVATLYRDHARAYPWAPDTHRQALEWIDDAHRNGKAFFLLVNDMEPHHTYIPPREFERRFIGPEIPPAKVAAARGTEPFDLFAHNLDDVTISAERLRIMSDLYDAEIACLDDEIGRLLEELRERGLLDDTIVVIAGDHGENLGEHGLVDHMFSLHRTIRHVPLLIRFPPYFEGGRSVSDTVRLEDVAPTVLEMAGLEVPPDLDGASLLRDLPGRIARATLGPPNVFLDRIGSELRPGDDLAHLRARIRAVYDGRHHLIRYSDGREELYDVKRDPLETRNLAGDSAEHGEVLSRLRSLIPAP